MSVLQTGNILFAGDASEKFRERLAAAYAARFRYVAEFFLRIPLDWRALLAANLFAHAAYDHPQQRLSTHCQMTRMPGRRRPLRPMFRP